MRMIVVFILFVAATVNAATVLPGPYEIESIRKWRDADTFEADVIVWPSSLPNDPHVMREAVRVRGLNATEVGCPDAESTLAHGKRWVDVHWPVYLTNVRRDGFGRILADVVDDEGKSYVDYMMSSGTAVEWYHSGASKTCVGE